MHFIAQHLKLWLALWALSAAIELWLMARLDRALRKRRWIGYAAVFAALTVTTVLTGLVVLAFLHGLVNSL